ncbi:MAG: hypothetical protein ACETWB_06380 [Anaerolineae bacterium]
MENMDFTVSEIGIDVRGLKEDVAMLKEDDLGIDDKTSRRI